MPRLIPPYPTLAWCLAVVLGGPAGLLAIDAPTGLLCDLMPNAEAPTVTPAPAFSWIVGPAEPASVQRGYQILVASSPTQLAAGTGDWWDSGAVTSADSVAVRYRGKPLPVGSTGNWQVRIQADDGSWSPYSKPAQFAVGKETGLWPRQPLTTTRIAGTAKDAGGGAWSVDFQRAAIGWFEVTIDTPAATTLTVCLGEKLAPDGRIDRKPGGTLRTAVGTIATMPGSHTYRLDLPPDKRNTGKDAVKIPPALGVIMPFRYAEISGCPATPSVTQVCVHYPFDLTAARFSAGHPTLDAVWNLCHYSMQATSFCGLYVDGDRERIAYEGDAYINQLGHYASDREFAIGRATYEYLLAKPTWPTEWAQCMVLIAWNDWMYTGDIASVQRTWDRLVAEKSLRGRMRADGLLDTTKLRDLVDWPVGERDHFDFRPVNTVVNAYHCRVQECLGDLAAALGKTDEAARCRADAQRALAALNAKLVDPATGLYVDGEGSTHSSLHANAFPLAFGLVPIARQPAVVAFLTQKGMACSVYAAQFLVEGLFKAGAADQAIGLMANQGPRTWADMLAQGSTITMEAWSLATKANQDWNHAWGAAPANLIPRFVLGIEPLTAGSGLLRIHPQLGPLTHAEGTVPTIRGPVTVIVDHRAGEAETITVTIPGNTRAQIELGDHREEVGPGRHTIRR
jgi:alpha-L-rhamnosidase